MNKLLPHCCTTNIRRIKSCFPNRLKCDLVKSEKFDNELYLIGYNKRVINKHLFYKIWNEKDQKTKQKLLKAMMKINSRYNMNTTTIDFQLKSKTQNNSTKMNEHTKLSSCTQQAFTKEADKNREKQYGDFSKRDKVSRPIRRDPGEVIWGFIPKEWVTFFVPKTGQSGFYTFLVTFCTYLLSKEIYVCDHEYYNGISLAILCIYVVKKHGPVVAKYLDREIDKYERDLNAWKEKKIQSLKDYISTEKEDQDCMEGQKILIDAKRENVHLQREAEFRTRQMEVYEEVTRKLNYHVEHEKVRKMIQHKNLVQWVTKEVEKSLTPELKEKYMNLCMADIKEIIKRNKE